MAYMKIKNKHVRLFIYLIISESGVLLMTNKCKPTNIVSTMVAEGRYYG
jgi:hypothetical protein